MREDVKAAFSVPILVLVGTERLNFAEVAGVLLAYKGYSAVFFLGGPSDTRHSTLFASCGKNEAWLASGARFYVLCQMQEQGPPIYLDRWKDMA
jgi:hypothetical protein